MYCQEKRDLLDKSSDFFQKSIASKEAFDGNFDGCKLIGEDLTNAYFPYGNFCRGNLRYVKLQNAVLNNTQFDFSDLSLANLQGASFYFASLIKTNLRHANLANANLRYANLAGADLSGAILAKTDLYGANLDGANFSGAILDRTNFCQARNANFKSAYMDPLSIDINGLPCLR
ncbi:MAG: pentapeptide repeat-containing protein [Cyanobacteria bacterium J06600_6]